MKTLLAIALLAGCAPPPPAAPVQDEAHRMTTIEERRKFCLEAARTGRLEDVCKPREPQRRGKPAVKESK